MQRKLIIEVNFMKHSETGHISVMVQSIVSIISIHYITLYLFKVNPKHLYFSQYIMFLILSIQCAKLIIQPLYCPHYLHSNLLQPSIQFISQNTQVINFNIYIHSE